MASRYQHLYEQAMQRVLAYERVAAAASSDELFRVAMAVLNRHGLAQEFVDELLKKPKPFNPE